MGHPGLSDKHIGVSLLMNLHNGADQAVEITAKKF